MTTTITISLKFNTDFDHVTPGVINVQG